MISQISCTSNTEGVFLGHLLKITQNFLDLILKDIKLLRVGLGRFVETLRDSVVATYTLYRLPSILWRYSQTFHYYRLN